jgi:hypothetical protein
MTPLTHQEIARALPSLRRYARAVTGDPRSGDRYIRIALEILVEEPWRVRAGRDVRFHLYKLFDDVLSVFEPGPPDGIDRADSYHRLKHGVLDLPLLSRKLLLLVLVERFPLSRASALLDMPEREAEVHLAGARARLSGFIAAFQAARAEPVSQEQAA